MALPIHIVGADGAGSIEAKVTQDGGLLVATYPAEIRDLGDQATARRYYQGFFTTAAGSNAMNINGALTPTVFQMTSDLATIGNFTVTRAKAIYRFRFLMQGSNLDPTAASQLRRFGPVTAPGLVNGLQLVINQGAVLTNLFPTTVKTLWELFQNSDAIRSYPNAISTGADALFVDFILTDPIIIDFGSGDTLQITVQDDLSGFIGFQILATGRYELDTD